MIPIGFVIDTWVWVEYYLGEDPRVNEYIENESIDLFTSTITLTELIKFLHQKGESPENIRQVVFEIGVRSLVLPVTEPVAILAGEFRSEGFKGGIVDTIILATARSGGHRVVTGDSHFKGLDDAVFLG
ncbi:PIN domain-containing protein [uncultured Methanoregula sp.]|uniref:PIN domain-containing protein n=1 Tax=uncultured Methanoregula sp. TaxID=1005933 RepID=UPI002AAC4D82|nr:PIN domain-containing protein [uncultured Methanoregula sp.]